MRGVKMYCFFFVASLMAVNARLKFKVPLSAPKDVRARAVSANSVLVSWEVSTNRVIKGYKVYYTRKPEDPIFFWESQTVNSNNPETTISGLVANATYTISVLAFSAVSHGPMSEPIQVLTTQGVPSPPRNLYVGLNQEDPPNVKVTWQRPVETHGDIQKYKIVWGPQGQQYEEYIFNSEIYSFITEMLDKGTTYEFRVSARNEVDYGQRAVATIATPDGAPSGAPQNFTATGLTETSVRLTWDLPARRLRNGEIVMYQVTYHKLSDPINDEGLNCTDTLVVLAGLEMNTDYIFKIKAYTSKGPGPWSNRLHFRTYGKNPTQSSTPPSGTGEDSPTSATSAIVPDPADVEKTSMKERLLSLQEEKLSLMREELDLKRQEFLHRKYVFKHGVEMEDSFSQTMTQQVTLMQSLIKLLSKE